MGAERPSRLRRVASGVATVLLVVVVAVLVRQFVAEAYYVPSGSMLETIHEGDLVLGEKVSFRLRDPRPGDVVTFVQPDGRTLVKRVVAVAGQQVRIEAGRVLVDGTRLDEPYVGGQPTYDLTPLPGSAGIAYPYTVPDGCVWVMGDNRTDSKDSRYFGPVSIDDVTSRAAVIYWPPADMAVL